MTLDDQLRRHDSARDVPEDLGRAPRAAATLARVTATAPGNGPRPVHRKRAARFALAAVVVVAGLVVAPVLGTDEAALGSWEPDPRPATGREGAHYAAECAEWTGAAADYEPKVIEVRGTWVMTYLVSANGEAQCLRSTEPASGFVDGANQSMSGPLLQTPAANGLATTGVLETSAGLSSTTYFMVAGKVGTRVTEVVFASQGMQVRATVRNGYFTAWWPRRKPASIAGRLLDNTGYNGSPNPDVTLTLSDGEIITRPIKEYDANR
ncbi:hypothetical protein Ait01nite_079030 [Actinoplanes italicus]|uniref:Uncharacterized protein n=1 Tax=Actinoplanes italicus TaxID=113567 RepID=A0A2T0JNE1_9ACTN|nr:hypothetical protein [Actinoplanes italicus]PRX09148.1 hypothetical protein CLV67_13713 [Actinoplanes italicus]GIE34858.1 hypothetical protein Ait01nite_079030 [Actinoplanes italicus]